MAIIFTSLSYYFADRTIYRYLVWWQPLLIGTSVVAAGALVEKLNAPMWLIIVIPFPIGMILLMWFFNWSIQRWFFTYSLTLVYYVILHIVLSWGVKFDSLIPAWKLHN